MTSRWGKPNPPAIDTVCRTTAELVESIAKETAGMPNRQAWPKIHAKLRAAGRSARRARELQEAVWAARKRNAATARAVKTDAQTSLR